ncbi:Aminopeptidase 2 mitochondrial [Myotisia sp. PD_48]|nr:Aminopeptidase 2 mitochondrial [Myotisia sp. PD_48]
MDYTVSLETTDPSDSNYAGSFPLGTNEGKEDDGGEKQRQIGIVSATFLIFNRIIGTGIFATPSVILALTGSVGMSLIVWILGMLIAMAGTAVYLEFGTAIPRNGGEKNYLEYVYRRPKFLATAIYASYAMFLGWAAGNSVVFGEYMLHAADVPVNRWNQRGIGLACITVAFLVHATEMKWGLRIQNALGILKLLVILVVVVCGVVALTGLTGVKASNNFSDAWGSGTPSAYGIVTALYSVVWSYIGYSNANYSLSETRDPVRTLKIAAPVAVTLVGVLYLLANIAYFAVVPKKEILESGQILAASFFHNMFGPMAARAMSIFIALSAFGNVMAVLFSQGRIVQALGEEGVLPFSRFWASSRPFNSPAAGLLEHYILSAVVMLAPPPGDAYIFLLNMISYPLSIVNILVAAGLIHIYIRPSRYVGWAPGIRATLPVTVFFLISNIYLTVAPFLPPQRPEDNVYAHLPYYVHCLAGLSVFVLGAVYWVVWAKLLPCMQLYELGERTLEEDGDMSRRVAVRVPSTKSLEKSNNTKLGPATPPSISTSTTSTARQRPLSLTPRQFTRYCSYRRMCRARQGENAPAGAMSVPHGGREVLPTNVIPRHYDLTLEPDFEKFTFEGTVVIDLDVVKDTTSITLNAIEIDIHSTIVSANGVEVIQTPTVAFDNDAQTATVSLGTTIPAGSKAQLKQKFTGKLNDNMAGFYRCSYKDSKGNKKYLASSQMEPTDARRAFPCFDEPALKAAFTVTLVADKQLTCLSNMDVASETEVHSSVINGTRKAVKFTKSPLMSTYLVAFIVGELNHIETNHFRVPIRVYATPDQDIEHGRFSLELAAKTLAFYEKAFDSEFPLPKMDMVAVPDFAAGAMENWGLITYRIVDVLYDQKTAGAATKERIAETVQHELAHQWFGNLVTMDFWDGLWLNEGFATWMSWYSCNVFYPEWNVWQTYVIDNLQQALSLDSLRSSHPIEVPVKRADEINQIFDAISYSKGSAVLRMISKYMGEEKFLQGIKMYIKKHAYGNTTTSDLWDALSEASGKPIDKVMDIWTKNVGFPVVTVDENPANKTITVKQNRFLRTGDVKPEEDQILYPVVLGLKDRFGVDESVLLTERSQDITLPEIDFFKLNADHSALFRTCYSPERLEKLGNNAKAGLLTVEDKAGMIADAGVLAASGYQKTSGSLSLLKGFQQEKDFIVWNEILTRLGAIRGAWMFEDAETRDALKAFQRNLVGEKAHSLGWEFSDDDGHVLQQFKALMFGCAGTAGDQKVVDAAKDMFARFSAGDHAAIHPNIRGSVFDIALRHGGEKEYDVVLDRYRNAPTSSEKNTALRSLGSASDPKLIQRTLALSLSDEVRSQDIYMPLSGLRVHSEGVLARWEWLHSNWDAVTKRIPPAFSMLGTVIQMTCGALSTEQQLKEVEEFFKNKDTKGFDRSLAQSLDAIRAKAGWLKRDVDDVKAWLKANGY